MSNTKEIIIAGGGAAGMVAAIAAVREGAHVHLFEKNEKLGKKIFITGKGRCNVTNACDMEELMAGVVTNARFLYSSFYGFTNQDVIDLLARFGCQTKVERGNRVFPVSDHSSDVIRALGDGLRDMGVQVRLNTAVDSLILEDGRVRGVRIRGGKEEAADAVVVATGGLSYPTTGSTGDGFRFAADAGHKVTELSPALVPFNVREIELAKELQGLALKNVEVTILDGRRELYREFGEMLFTHFGVSGPVLLSASSFCTGAIRRGPLTMEIDLKPALSEKQLDERILRDFGEARNKQFKNTLSHLYPAKLVPVMIRLSGISPDKQVNEITKAERERLNALTKHFTMTLTGLRDYKEAIITQGGVSVKEINPSTMESKLVRGLYFAGEVLDLDAVTGGFNLQIAWSTGWAAGSKIEF